MQSLHRLQARAALRIRGVLVWVGSCMALTLIPVAVLVAGCANVQGNREATAAAALGNQRPNNLVPELFRKGEQQTPEGIVIAKVTAAGNVYANRQQLEAKLVAEAAAVGADYVVATHQEVLKDKVVHHPHSGLIGLALNVAQGTGDMTVMGRPVLHGVACRRASASLGAVVDQDGRVQYVRSESAAERAGLREGMRLLAINENFIHSDEFVFAREVFARNPGDVVQIDAITPGSEKVRVAVMLEKPVTSPRLASSKKQTATPSPPPKPPSGS